MALPLCCLLLTIILFLAAFVSFTNADVENADFTEAALGNFDLKNLCKNPTLKGENPVTGADTRFSVGCGP
jgi:hypothetical protein